MSDNPKDEPNHTSSEKTDEAYTTTVLPKVNSSTVPRYTFREGEDSLANKTVLAAVDNSAGQFSMNYWISMNFRILLNVKLLHLVR